MCERYARRGDKQKIAEAFSLDNPQELALDVDSSPDIVPITMQPVIVAGSRKDQRELRIMRWGMVPPWVKTLKGLKLSAVNARAEEMQSTPLWRKPFEEHRCLVPADAFYAWKLFGTRTKEPYAFSLGNDSMFAFAGVWSHWRTPDGALSFDSYAIITTQPNELTRIVHNRMPVIIRPKDYSQWLNPGSSLPADLLCPYDAYAMKTWQAGPTVEATSDGLIDPTGTWWQQSRQSSVW